MTHDGKDNQNVHRVSELIEEVKRLGYIVIAPGDKSIEEVATHNNELNKKCFDVAGTPEAFAEIAQYLRDTRHYIIIPSGDKDIADMREAYALSVANKDMYEMRAACRKAFDALEAAGALYQANKKEAE